MYGSHLAMQLATERQRFGKQRRAFGLESSTIALETVMGTQSSMEFEDFLDQPSKRAEIPKIKLHDALELQYGI